MPHRTSRGWLRVAGFPVAAALVAVVLASCSSSPGTASTPQPAPAGSSATSGGAASPAASGSQAPAAGNKLAPGDIPDTTVYVPFQLTAGHVLVKVPEGWARQATATSATFTSSLNTITIAAEPMKAAPSVSSAQSVTVPALSRSIQGFKLQSVQAVNLSAGPAVEIVYQTNSQPDPVTGRVYRLVVERFELLHGGHGAALSLSSAVGSDNVDPWRIVSQSLRWR